MKKGYEDCKTKVEEGCKDCEEYYNSDVGCWEKMTTENVEKAKEGTTCAGDESSNDETNGASD